MPSYQVEMWWVCDSGKCERTHGRNKRCEHCGRPRTKDCKEGFYDGSTTAPIQAVAIKEPELIRKASGGEDYKCSFCGCAQFKADNSCLECGAAKDMSIGKSTIANNRTLPKPPAYTPKLKPEYVEPQGYKFPVWGVIGVAVFLLSMIWLVFYIAFHVTHTDTTVKECTWVHTIHIDRLVSVHHESFLEDKPVTAESVVKINSRFHHNISISDGFFPETYSVQERCGENCSTTPRNCRSNKNGFANCSGGDRVCTPRYCSVSRIRQVEHFHSEPRYADWLGWNIWEWVHNRDVTVSGNTIETWWAKDADIRLGIGLRDGEQERMTREEKYLVLFNGTDHYEYVPTSEAEFKKFYQGSKHHISYII